MKRTLIITLEYPPKIGGIATYIDQLAQSLDPQSVMLLAPKQKGAAEWDAHREFLIIRKNPYFPSFMWPRWIRLYFQVKKLVKQYGIEMIHVHHILPVGTVAKMIKKKFGIPYLIFSHGTDIVAASKKPRKRKLAASIAADAEQIVMNSHNLESRLLEKFPEAQGKTTVVYPCPDKEFKEEPNLDEVKLMMDKYALEGKKVILTISRLTPGKGFKHLIAMMPEILKRVPHLVWFIVGDGEQKDEIIALIRKHNLHNIVRFIGEIPHEELRSYYHIANLFVLLTHPYQGYEEGLGLVFLEASAAGLPIIAGKSGGVPEAVLDGQTGRVIDLDTKPQEIIDSIVHLLEHPEEAEALGAAGQARIQKEFQWDVQLGNIQEWL